ncbi:MAG: PEP-CTERM sorting domain-containing protein [Verrucomicrobiota bacterium]
MKRFVLSLKLSVSALLLLSVLPSGAVIVINNLSGNTDYDGWDDFSNLPGYGTFEVGPFAPPGTPWPSPIGSFEAGSGNAEVNRTAGTHYSAGISLYSFAGSSDFTVFDPDPIGGLATVVLTLEDWEGSSATSDPLLSFNGGTQSMVADFTSSSVVGSGDFGGPFLINARTFQWDVSSLGSITSFNIDWTQGSSAGLLALQLEQSDVFSIASAVPIPEPQTAVLLALVSSFLLVRRRGRAGDRNYSSFVTETNPQ